MKAPTWIYHATEPAKIVDAHEAHEHYKKGWADTPAAFINPGENDGKSTNESTDEAADEIPSETRKGRTKRMLSK